MIKKTLLLTLFSALGILAAATSAAAPIAGSSTVGIAIAEMNEVVTPGWSTKKSILGKPVYNENGEKVGSITDLIISSEKQVSYAIIGAGGFIGIGRHDVAIPVSQLKGLGGRMVLTGATKDIVKAMPRFKYASDAVRLNQFIARSEHEIQLARLRLVELQSNATTAAADAKVKLDAQIVELQQNLKAAEDRLAAMRRAGAQSWRDFESDMSAAISRLRKSLEKAVS